MILQSEEVLKLLPTSLANEEFAVYFQPQYNHSTGRLVGSEALVRWISPVHGVIPPMEFIPLLESNGLISELDIYVFEHVCRFLRHALDAKLPLVHVSVNLSRCDMKESQFVQHLETIREKYQVPTEFIHLEITESAVCTAKGLLPNP